MAPTTALILSAAPTYADLSTPTTCTPTCTPTMVAREVFAFCTSCTVALLGKHLDIITTVAAFGHHPPDPDLVTLAHKRGVRVVVGCDFDKMQLANATARTAWIGDQVANVKSLGIDGLNLDIEGNTANRAGLTALVTELRAALTAASPEYQLSFDLGIGPKGQASGYDHLALSRHMNFTVPMAYDECWGTKKASANSPIDRLKKGMDDYSSLGVPASKLVLGLPWYGWDFPCTEASGDVCSVDPPAGKPWYGYATQVGYTDVLKLANNSSLRPTTPVLDTESMTQHFDYVATSGQRHQVWYDDPTTLKAKYEAVADKGGLGVAMWTANFGDEPMWEALRHFAR